MKMLPAEFIAAGRTYRVIARHGSWALFERNRGLQVDYFVSKVYISRGRERLPGVLRWSRNAWATGTEGEGQRILTEKS